jgi:hypothetical protein
MIWIPKFPTIIIFDLIYLSYLNKSGYVVDDFDVEFVVTDVDSELFFSLFIINLFFFKNN